MHRLLDHFRTNLIAYLALFIALGGTSYAAFTLPANSVGTRQLKRNSITPIKFNTSDIAANIRAWAVIEGGTQVVASRPKAKVVDWDPSAAVGDISWGRAISADCFPLTSGGGDFVQAVAWAHFRGIPAVVHFGTFTAGDQPNSSSAAVTFVAVLCPQR